MLPLVSTIIPYYNHGRHLHQTVHSALRAYSGPSEIIIVNDGSLEAKAAAFLNSAKLISPSVKVIDKPNGGLSSARNAGLEVAKGDFVQLLDSDDILMAGKIDLQLRQFIIQPDLDISVSNYLLCDELGTHFNRDGDPISRFDFSLEDFMYRWERGFSIPIHCGLFRRHVFEGISFSTEVIGKEDWIFWCTQAGAKRKFGYLPFYGAIYRQHNTGMSKSFGDMGKSFLHAAKLIERELSPGNKDFQRACEKWYADFYLTKMHNSSTQLNSMRNAVTVHSTEYTDTYEKWQSKQRKHILQAKNPILTVVIPVYNHYNHLRQCISSLLNQKNIENYEIIIIDDHSSDDRILAFLKLVERDFKNVKLILNPTNLGITRSQNIASEQASGKYLAFVDCDDFLQLDAFSTVSSVIKDDVDYIFTDRNDVDEFGVVLRTCKYGGYGFIKPSENIENDLLDGMVASHLKVVRRQIYMDVGGCDPHYSGVQDWELALRIAEHGGRFVYIPKPLYNHRIHSNSVTSSESVRQFCLSNIVRRKAARKLLKRQRDDEHTIQQAIEAVRFQDNQDNQDNNIYKIDSISSIETIMQIKKAWKENKICIYFASSDATVAELNLAREYNAYFDLIVTQDEVSTCSLIGYMWNHDALVYIGEPTLHIEMV